MSRRSVVRTPPFSSLLRSFSSSTPSSSPILSQEELTQIDSLIHRLCVSNHIQEAIHLLSTSLLLTAPSTAISSIPFLVGRLSSLPSLSPSFSLLTSLRRHHHRNGSISSSIPLFPKLLVASFLRQRRLKEASKIFSWMLREDNRIVCRPDEEIYKVYVGGICEKGGEAAEVVRAVREMVRDGLVVGEEVRGWVWKCMLREARIDEAKELEAAFSKEEDGDGVGKLLDRIIREWED